jgi:hypothetical protein
MLETWSEDISLEDADVILRKVAYEIKKRKLETPAILLFESHKPLSYVAGQATFFFAPLLVPILGYNNVRDYGRVLNRRDSIDRLLQYIEEPMENLQASDASEVKS